MSCDDAQSSPRPPPSLEDQRLAAQFGGVICRTFDVSPNPNFGG